MRARHVAVTKDTPSGGRQTVFHAECWARSALGTPIALSACRPLDQLCQSRPILLIGGVHGDEPEGVALAEASLAWLMTQAALGKGDSPVTSGLVAPWVVVPCLNVDGYLAHQRVNGRGVDLNRNYPSTDWSAQATQPRYNPGPSPGSEPEIQAITALIQSLRPRLIIHCHSWEPMVIATGPLARKDAERLARSSGYELVDSVGYPTPGSLSAYGWHDNQIPVICIEEQENLADLGAVWPRFKSGIEEIFNDTSSRGPG